MSLYINAKIDKPIKQYNSISSDYIDWSREEKLERCNEDTNIVFHWNVTHNLTNMASNLNITWCIINNGVKTYTATLYDILWQPHKVFNKDVITLGDLLKPLYMAFNELLLSEEKLSKFNPTNNWGSYEDFITLLPNYIRACKKWPNAIVTISK